MGSFLCNEVSEAIHPSDRGGDWGLDSLRCLFTDNDGDKIVTVITAPNADRVWVTRHGAADVSCLPLRPIYKDAKLEG